MIDIERLTADRWMAIEDNRDTRTMRRFVGSRDECEAVKAEWLAGNFKRGMTDRY
jgi:hypothetical protein